MLHTSKDGTKLLPAGDATLRGELTKGNLQEEDWQTSAKQENEVGDEKRTWKWDKKEMHIDKVKEKNMVINWRVFQICLATI